LGSFAAILTLASIFTTEQDSGLSNLYSTFNTYADKYYEEANSYANLRCGTSLANSADTECTSLSTFYSRARTYCTTRDDSNGYSLSSILILGSNNRLGWRDVEFTGVDPELKSSELFLDKHGKVIDIAKIKKATENMLSSCFLIKNYYPNRAFLINRITDSDIKFISIYLIIMLAVAKFFSSSIKIVSKVRKG
jgi:hypothetical protein